MIAPELIADAGSVDALSGVSGAILGLLACHAAHPSSDCLERATWCGDEILRRRDAAASSREWSLTPGRAPESGMAHGYSGVALALARLSHVTNDERYRDAALDALARERTLMRAVPEPGRHALSWASGCVGVGLARLSMSALIDDRELDDDLECALHAVCLALDAEGRDGVTSNDSLCDGRAGALEFLRLASVQLSRPSLADRAHALARAISGNRDGAASGLGWQHGYSHPGLMEGRAGIAYSLLRASVPSLPSVLVWL